MWEIILTTGLIFLLRIVDVSMGTVRTLLVMRGRRLVAALIGFVEVSIYVVAIGKAVQNLNSWWNIIAYGAGFAVGTYVGVTVERRMALGYVQVRITSRQQGKALAEALREAGYGATEIWGRGMEGTVAIIEVLARRRDADAVFKIACTVDPSAFITIEEPRGVYRGHLPRKKK